MLLLCVLRLATMSAHPDATFFPIMSCTVMFCVISCLAGAGACGCWVLFGTRTILAAWTSSWSTPCSRQAWTPQSRR